MHNLGFALEGAWRVLAASLILGAGLPAVFALGVRSLGYGAGGDAEAHDATAAGPAPRRLAGVIARALFSIALAAVVLAILFIVVSGLGKQLSFSTSSP